jgi:hypothetical protein
MTSPAPVTEAQAYQDLQIALGALSATITAVVTDPDFLASAADLAAELGSSLPNIIVDIVDLAECGFVIFAFAASFAP